MEFFEVDGSRGEGGGQILRSALALSCVLDVPVRVRNIRGGRRVPGLRAQHLASARILGEIFGADVSGLELGSTCIEFAPNGARDVRISEDVGTAGSISLILQSAVLAASMSGQRISMTVKGGTDVPWSPTLNYARTVLGCALERFGIKYSVDVRGRGYFPKGGGEAEITIHPCERLTPVSLVQRRTREAVLQCTFSGIGRGEAERQCGIIADRLRSRHWRLDCQIVEEDAPDRGASALLYSQDASSVIGADSLWSAKKGGFERDIAERFLRDDLGTDENLADMLVVPASRCGGTSVFRVGRITSHLETNLYVASKMTGCRYGIGRVPGGFEVRIRGAS